MENDRRSSRLDVERYNLEILLRRPSLRASISRRVSQVRRETMTTPDTTCGVGCIRGRWLQSFANRTTFIFVYEVLGSFYASYVAYFYGSITTLEKRFKFSSQRMGIIAASGDISKVFTCLVLSFFSLKVHKPRFLGFGVFLIILSILIFTSPHFLYPFERQMDTWQGNDAGNCTNPCQTYTKETHQNNAFFIFLLTQILQGTGAGIYLTQGKTYKDENVHMQQPPSLISLLSILKALGPAFGYWLSSVCLKSHEYLQKESEENETHWIGAWWLGSLVIGFILFVLGFFVVLFPPILPKAAVRRIFNIRGPAEDVEKPSRGKGLKFFNQGFMSYFSGTFNAVNFLPYFIYLPKYVEIQYRITSSAANLIAGSITLISASFGIVMASSVITRYRPNGRALAGWSVIVSVLSLGGLIFYTRLGCAENDVQIKTVAADLSSLLPLVQLCLGLLLCFRFSHWESSCQCGFDPVCVESDVILPSCHSKCNISFHNNTKVLKITKEILHSMDDAIKGLCPVDCYSDFLLFIIVTCLITFVYATGPISNFWFEIRHNDNKHKLRLVGLNFINMLVFIPGPIIFGHILDENCLLWDDNSKTGNCWLYDDNLKHMMNFTAVGFATIGVIFNACVWYSVKNLTLFPDERPEQDHA